MEGNKNQVSLRKIEANRKNAAKSTGPRTAKGKTKSRWNAQKHGLLSRRVVIEDGVGKESREEFSHLLQSLREDRQPVGTLEEMLVEKIAIEYWRLMRVMRCDI